MFQKLLYFLFIILFLSSIAVVLWISDLFLSVWDKLIQQPDWFFWSYLSAFILFIVFSLFLFYRLLIKTNSKIRRSSPTKSKLSTFDEIKNINIEQVEDRVEHLQNKEINIDEIRHEIAKLKSDQTKKDIRIVLFGDISSGKSSLINAILPTVGAKVSIRGGTTREVINYQWISPLGEKIILTDTPGFDEFKQSLDELSRTAVYKSHLSIYLCEGDLTATQYQQIKEVAILDKPLLVAFNKTDRYSTTDLDRLSDKIQAHLASIDSKIKLTLMNTGGTKEVSVQYADGTVKNETRERKPDLTELLKNIAQILQNNSLSELELSRQKSVLHLLSKNMDKLEINHQQLQSQEIIKASTKKAVIASMATISPGSDLLVQGYLGISMIKSLSKLYDIEVKEFDIDQLLKMLQLKTVGIFPLLLGIAGNGFKAFPGPGTLAGGLLHAVAYGLIFDSVGKAVNLSLSTQGVLSPVLIEDIFKEKLVENVESRALELVKMVIKSKTDSGS